MRPVVLLSPFRGFAGDYREAAYYLRSCIRDCALRGDAPYAGHRMMPGALDDTIEHERALGMACEAPWLLAAAAVVVYTDHGVSEGMRASIAEAHRLGKPVLFRHFGAEEAAVEYGKLEQIVI